MLIDNPTAVLILVVEDDQSHSELISRSFEDAREEYCLVIAHSLHQAKSLIEARSPDLVLADYCLPDGDGYELLVVAKGLWPVILMTSQGNEQIAVEAMKLGAHDYIVKSPEMFARLPLTVEYALKSWALILARRQIEHAILCAKRDWERTFDAVPDLISIIDINNTITRVNKAMAERCGLTPERLIGQKCCEAVHGMKKPPSCCPTAAILADGNIHNVETEAKKLNGFFDITISPLSDEEGRTTSFVHVMRDITPQKRAEEDRKKLEHQFQQTQKLESLGVLSGGIAHDFNNILTIILGYCYILKENPDSEKDRNNNIQMIESAANRAADLCRQMLAYAGKTSLLQTEFSLWMLLDEIVKMLSSAINKNVIIQLDMKRDLPMMVGDSSQIQQVAMNLIINAGEAIGESNGTIKVGLKKAAISSSKQEIDYFGNWILPANYACMEVSDTGCGMSEEIKQHIFEPFYTTKFAGRGLGMSAILGIIKAHNGTLQLTSTPGVGTTFKVYIPLPVSEEHVELPQQTAAPDAALTKANVLLVDDELTLLNMQTLLLEVIGFSVITAANGREALGIYKDRGREIDLVMLDLVMPEMGGIEAYHELRKTDLTVPIVICSGYGEEAVADVIKTDDKACFLHKPYNPKQLSSVLGEMIGR